MDYAQERVATLHDLEGHTPDAPVDAAAVVVPLAEREHASLAAERTFDALAMLDPGRVVVPLRAAPDRVPAVREWLDTFELPVELLWCGGERLDGLLAQHGLDGDAGKGRDVWLALGVAAEAAEYVVCHDADRRTYSTADVPRLLAPLADGFAFTKGYYARVEDGRLYGRLCRLCYAPLVRTLAERHRAAVLDYLEAFRYALAGEFGLSAGLARRLPVERRFGLEVGTLGGAFDHAGFDGTAQVDLGRYEHDHRSVHGPAGLADMATDVIAALCRVVEHRGVAPEYATLAERYRRTAETLLEQYAADAAANGLRFDADEERAQVEAYADAIAPPGADDRLPAWADAPLDPAEVREAATADLESVS
ncbi:MAG: glycosyl transferase family 2 [Halobacteriales archaeon]